jgi:hypothetical protein
MKHDNMLSDELVKVYYEDDVMSLHIATFDSEALYIKCLPILKADAKENGWLRVTESIEDENEK